MNFPNNNNKLKADSVFLLCIIYRINILVTSLLLIKAY